MQIDKNGFLAQHTSSCKVIFKGKKREKIIRKSPEKKPLWPIGAEILRIIQDIRDKNARCSRHCNGINKTGAHNMPG